MYANVLSASRVIPAQSSCSTARCREESPKCLVFDLTAPHELSQMHDESKSRDFLLAASQGAVDAVRQLLAETPSLLCAVDQAGNTALHLAGSAETARVLIQHGLSVDARRPDGWTPLHLATYSGNAEVVTALAAAGASINARCDGGDTALAIAAADGYTEIVVDLLSNGADPSTSNSNGDSALHVAAMEGYLAVVQALLSSGAIANVQNLDGRAPLHYAAASGQTSIIRALLEHGADPSMKDKSRSTPLDWAYDDETRDSLRCP